MKRHNNLYYKIYDINNLKLADKKARKGKSKQNDVINFDKDNEGNILRLHYSLKNKTYKTSPYKIFKIFEPKEREIFKLPYIDRITQHAIMNVIESIITKTFTKDTYSCIKGRGIHKLVFNIKNTLKDKYNTTYALKLDIKKFYPSVNHEILKNILRKKFKDNDLLNLLDNIINSIGRNRGIPIGNYISQTFGNIYLNGFDH